MGKVGGPGTSAISQLDKQSGFAHFSPRDAQLAALARMVQTLLERLDIQPEQPGVDTTLVVPASPLGSLVTLAPTKRKIHTTSSDRYNGSSYPRIHIAKYDPTYLTRTLPEPSRALWSRIVAAHFWVQHISIQ